MKSAFFAKGRAFNGDKKCQSVRHIPLETMVVLSRNRVSASLAPVPASPSVTLQAQCVPRDLLNVAKDNLLKNYQLEVERKEKLIHQQRDTISKLQSNAASIQELLRSQSEKIAILRNAVKTNQVANHRIKSAFKHINFRASLLLCWMLGHSLWHQLM